MIDLQADTIIANVERFLDERYNERHIQIVPVVRKPAREPISQREVILVLTVLSLSALVGGMVAGLLR